MQGESVTAFVRRFRLLERKLQDNRVPAYPEEARVIKLLDGLRLDERAISALLLAAGNKYNMAAVQEAVKIQYPAGSPPAQQDDGARPLLWFAMVVRPRIDDVIYAYDEEDDPEGSNGAYAGGDGEVVAETVDGLPDNGEPTWNALVGADCETVTSRRFTELSQSRGYYNSGGKKGRGRGGFLRTRAPARASLRLLCLLLRRQCLLRARALASPVRQSPRQVWLSNSTVCRTPHAWAAGARAIGDCPVVTRHTAQLTTAGHVLDAQGQVLENGMVTASAENEARLDLPDEMVATPYSVLPLECLHHAYLEATIPDNPRVLLQFANHDAALMIADTGCQRQVAGRAWHECRAREIAPLQPVPTAEKCTFSFGPNRNRGVASTERYYYPAGFGGAYVALGVSCVDVNAPALFSRPAFAALGAIPNLVTGGHALHGPRSQQSLVLVELRPLGHPLG